MPLALSHARQLLGLLPVAALSSAWTPACLITTRKASSISAGGTGHAAAAAASGAAAPPAAVAAAAAPVLGPPPVGTVFQLSKQYSPEEVASFCAITGDSNAIHADARAAAAAGLPGAILPGLLMAALFPAIIGSHFPGALYLSQSLKFKRYAQVGETVTATLTVERSSGSRITFRTLCCADGSGRVLVEGEALALIKPTATAGQQADAAASQQAAAGPE